MAKKQPKKAARKPVTTSEQIDRDQVKAALRKRKEGKTPTGAERASLRRYEKQEEEERRWHHYETVPKKHVEQMGWTRRYLLEVASKYGAPTADRTVSIPAVMRWLKRLLTDNARKLTRAETDDELMSGNGATSPALERYRRIKADREQIALNREEGHIIEAERLDRFHAEMAKIMRGACETLQKDFGSEAYRVLDEALAEADKIIPRIFGDE